MEAELPTTVEERCAVCRKRHPHTILKGRVARRGSAVEGTFQCTECAHVHQGIVELPFPLEAKPVTLPLIVSTGAQSTRGSVVLFAGDDVRVGDEIETESGLVQVTGIETQEPGKRVQNARVEDTNTIWAKSIDEIKVHFAVNLGEITRAFESVFGPDDEITVGEMFDLENMPLVAEKIVTTEGTKHRGSINVREIKRVWLRRVTPAPPPPRGRVGAAVQPYPRDAAREQRPSAHAPARGRGAPRPPTSDTRTPAKRSTATRGGSKRASSAKRGPAKRPSGGTRRPAPRGPRGGRRPRRR